MFDDLQRDAVVSLAFKAFTAFRIPKEFDALLRALTDQGARAPEVAATPRIPDAPGMELPSECMMLGHRG